MIKIFTRVFDYGDEVSFETHIPLSAVIARLTERIRSTNVLVSTLSNSEHPTLVGSVSSDFVILRKVETMSGTIFNPEFYGKFEKAGGNMLHLRGVFTMRSLPKAILTFFFAVFFLLSLVLVAIGVDITLDIQTRLLALFAPGMIVLLILFVRYCKWLSHNDVEWISNEIKSALSN